MPETTQTGKARARAQFFANLKDLVRHRFSAASDVMKHPEKYNEGLPAFNEIVNRVTESEIPIVVLSPHYDDAVCSSGGFIRALASSTTLTILNVFTGSPDEDIRNKEEESAVTALQNGVRTIDVVDYGFPDSTRDESRGMAWRDFMSQELQKRLFQEFGRDPYGVFISPLGGRRRTHLHHLIVRDAAIALYRDRVIYSQDHPYNMWQLKRDLDQAFIADNGLAPAVFRGNEHERKAAIEVYQSQLPGLYRGGGVPDTLPHEVYYVNARTGNSLIAPFLKSSRENDVGTHDELGANTPRSRPWPVG